MTSTELSDLNLLIDNIKFKLDVTDSNELLAKRVAANQALIAAQEILARYYKGLYARETLQVLREKHEREK